MKKVKAKKKAVQKKRPLKKKRKKCVCAKDIIPVLSKSDRGIGVGYGNHPDYDPFTKTGHYGVWDPFMKTYI